jgi:peroxiredoxin
MVPGAIFPDYELTDHTAKHRKLSELQGEQPMVLVLSRGSFCPKDRRQAEGLLQLHREMEVGYCRLVTISTDNITQTNENRSGIGAHWPFLADPRRIVQKDLDIAEYTDPVNNPMIPHVVVLEPGLVIHKTYNGTGSSDDPRWKSSARTCVLSAGNAGRIGTSQRPNLKRPGKRAARSRSIHTAKPIFKLSANRIRSRR